MRSNSPAYSIADFAVPVYGPGRVRVAGPVAAVLWEQERNSTQVEADFHAQRAFIVGAGKRKVQVPYDSFDYAYNAAMPVALNAF